MEDARIDDARETDGAIDGVEEGGTEPRLGDWLKDNDLIDLDGIVASDSTVLLRQRERFLW